ncbi:MAG: type II secretion system minor pseudopilin GspK [Pseudomonadota bacterium]
MKRQRGVALITVLLVVAIVTVVCAGLIVRQQLAIRASSNQAQARQALHYALGGEALAQGILLRDLQAAGSAPGEGVDHPLEAWARPLPTFPIDAGEISVRIEDLSGRFNLNSLVQGGAGGQPGGEADGGQPPGPATSNNEAVEQFQRLLLNLGIAQPAYAERLVDWLDRQPERAGENGAEDNDYLLAEPPYRTGDRRLEDVSELRLLLGMTEADYRLLLPHVSVLPADAPLNVNTAGAMVLSSLPGLTPGAAQALVQGRPAEGYRDTDPFKAALGQQVGPGAATPGGGGLNPDNGLDGGNGLGDPDGTTSEINLAVSSQYFQVISEVRLADRRQVLVSTLQRQATSRTGEPGSVRVLQRNFGQSARVAPSAPPQG